MANLKINTEKRKSLRSRLACLLSLSLALDVDVVVWWCRTDVSCIASAFRLRSGLRNPQLPGIDELFAESDTDAATIEVPH